MYSVMCSKIDRVDAKSDNVPPRVSKLGQRSTRCKITQNHQTLLSVSLESTVNTLI